MSIFSRLSYTPPIYGGGVREADGGGRQPDAKARSSSSPVNGGGVEAAGRDGGARPDRRAGLARRFCMGRRGVDD